jgi:tight adherence protein C
LISLVMKAGSSFNEAVETLIHDNPEEELNVELRVMLGEVALGTTRAQALENLAERVPLEALRSVVASVNQSEVLGTPMAGILAEQALTLRNVRAVTAEKKSASASLRILVPSMLIMLAVLLVVFGPMIVRFTRGEIGIG